MHRLCLARGIYIYLCERSMFMTHDQPRFMLLSTRLTIVFIEGSPSRIISVMKGSTLHVEFIRKDLERRERGESQLIVAGLGGVDRLYLNTKRTNS